MNSNAENRTFILDIGTRSVVGIAGHKEGDIFVVEAWDMEDHPRRAMIDGQIEDIEQVAKVAGAVKGRIEEKLGTTFTQVGVAAAGRALKTSRATAKVELPPTVAITPAVAYSLENAAVNNARLALDLPGDEVPYYCVGHSVVRYLLDGYPFQSAVGHKASLAEVEIIATFLPTEVVESLRRCMEMLELEVSTLTLEPIAAMRAVIPKDLRLLNLALVDIGAGTSDIALSRDGSVAGYTMATVAGDEVTEAIIRKYLVDFATAERLKMAMETDGPFEYTDILGFEHEEDVQDMLETIDPAVDSLAGVISDRIVECNAGEKPAAVFMVGGGSKTPGLCGQLATRIGLDRQRVALAGTQFSGKVLSEGAGLDGPEFATPVGIALVTAESDEAEGAAVTVNGRRVSLFTPGATSVTDALLAAGYNYSDLMGRNGRPLTFTLNGVRTTVRGGQYTTATLTVNNKPASLATPVENGDAITIVPATSGEDAHATIADYAGEARPLRVSLNGDTLLAGLIARVNGKVVPAETAIAEQDTVDLYLVRTVGELLAAAGKDAAGATILVNKKQSDASHELAEGDVIIFAPKDVPAPEPPAPPPPVEEPEEVPPPPPPPERPAPQPAQKIAAKPLQAPGASAGLLDPSAVTPARPAPAPPAPEGQAPYPVAMPKAEAPKSAAEPAEQPASAPAKPEPVAQSVAAPVAPESAPAEPDIAAQPAAAPTEPEAAAQPAAPQAAPAELEAAQASAPLAPAEPPAEPVKPSLFSQPHPASQPAPAVGRSLRVVLNGTPVTLEPKKDGEPHRLFDMLSLVDIDPHQPRGKVKVLVNGRDAPYLEELVSGDKIEIGWEG